jgi:hypothetical protein
LTVSIPTETFFLTVIFWRVPDKEMYRQDV